MSRALSFGVVAESYERFRPGYSEELLDLVMAYAGRPVETALEIGAGTGKATRLFAERVTTVTATEPDAGMLAELRKHVPANVQSSQAAFEDLDLGEKYGLVYAAAALHWTNPEGRWSRMAALLESGGVFASFGGPFNLADPAVAEAAHAARAPFLDSDDIPSPDGTPADQAMQWPGTEPRTVRVVHRCSAGGDRAAVDDECGRLCRSPLDRLGLSRPAVVGAGAGVQPDQASPARHGRADRRPHCPSRAPQLTS